MRSALGIAVFSGMLGVTFFGIFLTPVFYLTIRWLVERNEPPKLQRASPGGVSQPDAVGHPPDSSIKEPAV